MPISQPFSAMLLAGGRSERMGRDKAGLMVGGEPLWKRQIAKLESCGAADLFISGRSDGPYAAAGFAVVEDIHPGLGPLAGLEAGLRCARHDLLVALAVDLIDVPAAFLRELVQAAAKDGRGRFPVLGDFFQPLAAVYSRACYPIVEQCIAGSDHSMRNFLRIAGAAGLVAEYPIEPEQLTWFRNINSPGDLDERPA